MKLDILVMASHPDDAELSCSGTILSHIAQGYKVGIVDFTQGELGTRGNAALRLQEAENAAQIMGLSARENLQLSDGYFNLDESALIKVIRVIRKYQPEIVLANAIEDRHPDHGRGAELAERAAFLSGLIKIETFIEEVPQVSWRPKHMYHYIQDRYIKPDFIVDITPFFQRKIEAILAFNSQFYDPQNTAPNTYISSPEFLEFIKARSEEMGHAIGVKYGEGYTTNRKIGVTNLFTLI